MPAAHKFFNEQEQRLLIEAIGKAELNTSGEIRLHLENFCFGNEVKTAQKVFKKLGMDKTQERNGVLIYMATLSKKIAVIGDQGIHEKLGSEYWEKLVAKLIEQFKGNKVSTSAGSTSTGSTSTGSVSNSGGLTSTGSVSKAEALAGCIIDCGEQLGKFFPLKSDDKNELSNNISF